MTSNDGQAVTRAEMLKSHELPCASDCGVIMPLPVGAYVSILVLAAMIALAWIGLRRLSRRRKQAPSSIA